VQRRTFFALGAAALAYPQLARAQDDVDPATNANAPALRVLLGSGTTGPGADSTTFTFDGRLYRGTFTRTDDGQIVNVLPLESYLYSVVPREMPPAWPAAALGAQAVCARTYVLQRSNPQRYYDLVPSEVDQVYGGVESESPAGRDAVDATAGQVLRYDNAFASIAYSSCCGGHTEASSDAWNGPAIPYLQGVVCTSCGDSPNYRWTANVDLGEIAQRFSAELEPFGGLHDVRITAQDASGRARAFELVADRGSATVKGTAFRLGVGTRVLRSLLITDANVQGGTSVVMNGGGLGHGVGMCQWGARGMAMSGRSVNDILAAYFPGTQLANE
jgi:stage II sporulation protein D